MRFKKAKQSVLRLLAFCLFGVVQGLSPALAQCPIVVGGSDFYDKAHSDTIWAGDFNLVETKGPSGSKFSSQLTYADSAQAFVDPKQNVYGVTTNPHLLDSTYIDENKNMLVVHVANNKTSVVAANTKLFSYRIEGLEKGSDFKITFDATCVNGDKYGIGTTFAQNAYKFALEAGVDLDQYGSSSIKTKETIKFEPGKTTKVTLTGTLSPSMDYIQLDMITGYNFMEGLSVGISNLVVEGCYKPHIMSNQGIEVCRGEQVLISLDKEYNADSYEWFMSEDGGKTFTSKGKSKNLYVELLKESYAFYCLVNGVKSDVLEVKTIICCVDANGMPMSRMDVFFDDFGYFDGPHSYTDAFGNSSSTPATYMPYRADVTFDLSQTGMDLDPTGNINDGFYSVVVPGPKGYCTDQGCNATATWMSGVTTDHSGVISGKANGGALFMNVTMNYKGVIFSRQIDGLCSDKNIFFETYIANLSGGSDPEVTINIKDAASGKLLATEKQTAKADAGWIRVHIDKLQITSNSIILEIESTGDDWQNGNDLIIDDIRFMVCSPPSVDVYSDLSSFASDTTICSDTDFEMGTEPSELLKNFFDKNPYYLFQHSTDGKTWENIGAITNAPLYKFNTADFPADINHFRVVVAKEDALKVFLTDPNGADYDDKCRNYSISKSFKIIRAGSIDMGKDQVISECGGLIVNLNGSNDGTLVRWSWEDADGTVLVATTSDEKAKVYDYKVTDDAVLTFTGYNKDGCMGKRKFTITKKNTVEFTVDSTMECDKTVVSIADAPAGTEFTWFYGGVKMTETAKLLDFDETTVDGELKVIGNATGLCESDTSKLDITVHVTPSAPTPIATEAQEQVKKGESFDYSSLVSAVDGLQWASSENGPWSADAITQSLDVAGDFNCFIRIISKDGCPSEAVELKLTVNSAPMPTVANDTVCVGTEVDFTKYIVKSNEADGFELAWYESETATSSTAAPVAKTATETDDVLEYWVTQKNDQAESDKAHISVVVAKVAKPVVASAEVTYCYNETAAELSATVTPNPSKYIFASGSEWRNGATVMTDLTPSTATPGATVYSVYGKFDVADAKNGEAVCYSEPTNVTVTVTKVDAPATSTVNYLKTDAQDNGGKFKDLMAQSSQSAAVSETGCTLKWYDADKNPLSAVPSPPYNANNDDDVELKYYVSQLNGKCESELAEVLVVISASPMPVTAPLSYCQDAIAVALTATISTTGSGSDKVSDYTLVWYSSNPNELKTEADKAALALSSAPVPSTKVTNSETSQDYTYYVAQKKQDANGKDVVSRATPLVVTVYAKPVLSVTNPAAVCEPATINLSNKDYWTVKAAQVTANAYFDTDKTTKYPTPNAVSKSGTYYVEASFLVNNEECKSAPAAIEVVVDYIRGLAIEGDLRACPGESAKLKATTTAFEPSGISYTWTSAEAGVTFTTDKADFTTTALAGPAGKKYVYSLTATAGACTVAAAADHTITIGDGPVEGTLAIAETGNTESTTFTVDDANTTVSFNTCGGAVSITPSLKATLNDFAWTLNGASVGSSVLNVPANQSGDYVLSYTNGCKTSVKVKVKSIPLGAVVGQTSGLQLCEGDNFSTSIIPSCSENTYNIAWYKDGIELAEFANKREVGFTPATAANNGVYSYKVTNNGCTVEGKIGEGKPLKVNPYIQLTYERIYVAPRGSSINIPLNISVPSGSAPSNVIWYESGVVFDKGTSVDLKVNGDYKFKVALSDDDYCDASAEIAVYMDAKLQMGVTVDDVMCQGDSRDLVIDTTGTGKFYYNGMQGITVVENTATFGDRVYNGGWIPDAKGKLHLSVSPVSDATYTIRYFYMDGLKEQQELVSTKKIQVLDPVSLVPPLGLSVCGDGESVLEIPISVTPAGTRVVWDEDPSITSGFEGASIEVAPVFDANTIANIMTKTYIVRGTYSICSEVSMPVNINIVRPLKGVIVAPEGICEGMSATVDASSYQAAEYVWNYDTISVSDMAAVLHVTPEHTTLYEVEMTRGECSATDEFELVVSPRPRITSIDSVYYDERVIVVSDGSPAFTYWLDNNKTNTFSDPHLVDISYGKHTIHVIDNNACETEAAFYVSAPEIKIPVILTPNGDGINDFFVTQIIKDAFPNANIKIFDRWGKKLVEYKGSEDGWDGTYNGQPMPSTDYWYEIEVKELKKTYTGHFTLMRQ